MVLKFRITVPYWYANLNKAGVMARICPQNAKLKDVKLWIADDGRPRGFATIWLEIENSWRHTSKITLLSENMKPCDEVSPLYEGDIEDDLEINRLLGLEE